MLLEVGFFPAETPRPDGPLEADTALTAKKKSYELVEPWEKGEQRRTRFRLLPRRTLATADILPMVMMLGIRKLFATARVFCFS
ncbi:hypothetical protein MPNT_80070 [Candidatus Methylacidithermus pantelleriae]|uniref:Uncharacterized protein n=1 Tax=Candidatus Methylacidithermus pantelleriae TaxID=2744239 RepID=A0A8J2FPT7_9BACT|nr:hypothetical protein MPNT_80070 [Candidatus Methylacidithermus pantelleriae]